MKRALLVLGAALFLVPMSASAATIELREIGFTVDGVNYDNIFPIVPLPASINGANVSGAFDLTTGLGTVNLTLTGVGAHQVVGFFDHDVIEDPIGGNPFNDFGSTSGAPASNEDWEIDDPFNDIFANVSAGTLDNQIWNGVAFPNGNDVSMALSRDFVLAAGQTAVVSFIASSTAPSGFYLHQTDASGGNVYLRSTLEICGGGTPPPIPEPGTLFLVGSGAAMGLRRLRQRRQS